jgi:hypothetical protein
MTCPTVHCPENGYDRCRPSYDPTKGFTIVRFRSALAVMVAALMLLMTAGIASAQTSTTDTTTSGYTDTTSSTTEVKPTTTTKTTATKPATEGQSQSSAAPAVAAQQAPSSLAFTGGEPLLFIFAGLAIAGGTASLLVRDRRRNQN